MEAAGFPGNSIKSSEPKNNNILPLHAVVKQKEQQQQLVEEVRCNNPVEGILQRQRIESKVK